MTVLKIATFNINGIRSRLPALMTWLAREQPDIVWARAMPGCVMKARPATTRRPGANWHHFVLGFRAF